MAESQSSTVFIAEYGYSHEPASEYRVYDDRGDAVRWLKSEGLDPDELEEYTAPGGEHESATIDRTRFTIREREVR